MKPLLAVMAALPLLMAACASGEDSTPGVYTFSWSEGETHYIKKFRVEGKNGEFTKNGAAIYSGFSLDDEAVLFTLFHDDGQVSWRGEESDPYDKGYVTVYLFTPIANGGIKGCAHTFVYELNQLGACRSLDAGSQKADL